MHTHRTPDVALWDQYRALREQWTHEDMLIGHRITWLILSEGLLFNAYVALSAKASGWLAFGFTLFGIAVAALIGVGVFTALRASGGGGRRALTSVHQRVAGRQRREPGEVAVGRPQLGHAVRKADRGDARVVNRPALHQRRQRQRFEVCEVAFGFGDEREVGK
jgi:hypothetical protein